MEIQKYQSIILRWLPLLIIAVVAGAWISTYIANERVPVYESRVRLIVGPNINSSEANIDVLRASQSWVLTYRELATTRSILDAVIERLQLPMTRGELADLINVQSSEITRFLEVRVRDAQPIRAAEIANELAAVLLEQASSSVQPESRITVVETAQPAAAGANADKPLIILLGTIGALMLALGLAVLVEFLLGHVQTEDELHQSTGAPTLGTIKIGPLRRGSNPFLRSAGGSRAVSNQYRVAALKLLAGLDPARSGKTILLCSPTSSSDVAEIAAYMGAACTQMGFTTLLIDADRHNGELTRFFGVEQRRGFFDVISRANGQVAKLHQSRGPIAPTLVGYFKSHKIALHGLEMIPNLFVLPAGLIRADQPIPADYIDQFIEALQRTPLITIIAGPPVATSADALLLARSVDSVVMLAMRHETAAQTIVKSVENLHMIGAKVEYAVFVQTGPLYRLRRLLNPRRGSVHPTMIHELSLDGSLIKPITIGTHS